MSAVAREWKCYSHLSCINAVVLTPAEFYNKYKYIIFTVGHNEFGMRAKIQKISIQFSLLDQHIFLLNIISSSPGLKDSSGVVGERKQENLPGPHEGKDNTKSQNYQICGDTQRSKWVPRVGKVLRRFLFFFVTHYFYQSLRS